VGRYCERHSARLASLRRVFSAGAPVPPHVLRRMRAAIHADGEVYTPYGATEALPVASIAAGEVLSETAQETVQGAGYCVGRRFPGIQWKVIRISDAPIAHFDDVEELPQRQVGELIVRGEVVTSEYITRREANALHKIADNPGLCWHRMGDVGYLDERERFWFCGRKSQRVETAQGTLYTVPCEAIFNAHAAIYRSALAAIGPRGAQRPVIIAEPWPEQMPRGRAARQQLIDELLQLGEAHSHTRSIRDIFLRRQLPVDIRHNAKIFREKLSVWAAKKLEAAR
jgi:acyl-CoA synthetase (AMP-forming)/AMP-acid ligase II